MCEGGTAAKRIRGASAQRLGEMTNSRPFVIRFAVTRFVARASRLTREKAKNLAGEAVADSEHFLRLRVKMHGLLVQPDEGRLGLAVPRPWQVVGRAPGISRVVFHGVVVQRETLARSVLRARKLLRKAVVRRLGSAENQRMIQQRRNARHAPAHLLVPELNGPAPPRLPVRIQVQDEVDSPPPILLVMVHGEIGVEIQESSVDGLMQPAAFERRIRNQIRDPRQLRQPLEKLGGVELVHYFPKHRGEKLALREARLVLVVMLVLNPLAAAVDREFIGEGARCGIIQKFGKVNMRIWLSFAILSREFGNGWAPAAVRKQPFTLHRDRGGRHQSTNPFYSSSSWISCKT